MHKLFVKASKTGHESVLVIDGSLVDYIKKIEIIR
jgi:hypothetical protein